jgi:hypothetical protein
MELQSSMIGDNENGYEESTTTNIADFLDSRSRTDIVASAELIGYDKQHENTEEVVSEVLLANERAFRAERSAEAAMAEMTEIQQECQTHSEKLKNPRRNSLLRND